MLKGPTEEPIAFKDVLRVFCVTTRFQLIQKSRTSSAKRFIGLQRDVDNPFLIDGANALSLSVNVISLGRSADFDEILP
jgi:hypothetical protein